MTVEAKAGWTVKVTTTKLAKPLVTDDGNIDDIVSVIDWKAITPADGIAVGQFGEFTIDADGLPDNESQVVFKAIQTYSNGDIVRWIDPVTPGGPEADHPTPILELTKPNGAGGATVTTAPTSDTGTVASASTKDNSARVLGIIGIAARRGGAALRNRRPDAQTPR